MRTFSDAEWETNHENEPPLRRGTVWNPDLSECLVVIDERGSIRQFSAKSEQMFCYRESEVLDRNFDILMPALDPGRPVQHPVDGGARYFRSEPWVTVGTVSSSASVVTAQRFP